MDTTNNPDVDTLWDYEHPELSESRFRQLLTQIAPESPLYLELLTQIARAQGLQRHFAEAHQTLDTVQQSLPETPSRATVRYLLERGRVFNSSAQLDQAQPLFLQAWELAQSLGEDFYAVDAAHMLGIAEPAERQLAWNLRALQWAEQSSDPRAKRWLGSLYNNIGWTYHTQRQYRNALTSFQQAVAWRAEQGQIREEQIARWCVARTLRSLDRVEEALEIQRTLAAELERTEESDGYVYEELAECLHLLGLPDQARPYFARAYQELSRDLWLCESDPDRIARLKQLGGV